MSAKTDVASGAELGGSLLDTVHAVVIHSVNNQHVTPRHDQIKLENVVCTADAADAHDDGPQVFEITFSCSKDTGPMKASGRQLASLFLGQVHEGKATADLARLIDDRFTLRDFSVKSPDGFYLPGSDLQQTMP